MKKYLPSIILILLLILASCSVDGGAPPAAKAVPEERVEFKADGSGFIEFSTNYRSDMGYSFYRDSGVSWNPLTALTVEIKRESGSSNCGLLFSYRDSKNYYLLELGADRTYRVWKLSGGSYTPLTAKESSPNLTSKSDLIKITYNGTDSYSLYFNGSPGVTFKDSSFSGGGVRYFVDVGRGEEFPEVPLLVKFR